ncbi:phage virion morphogenesis protein [Pandoraea sputorum]|uniref:Bacteriophage-like protein n=1 Tax=Pandoraea sputorum TaxID=93222 RepID=A0A5E5BIB3_9BURK|nr:hypothetical protein [Pandoraea sputorum]VVE85027.1 bacteriophage-like protein [Pandoraea sputorum]
MNEFGSLGQFALHLVTLQAGVALELHRGLKRVAVAVDGTAKSEFGEYQQAAGPFPAWAPLAESTKTERERLGFAPDEPLCRTGELRDSVSHEVSGHEAVIGSTSDVMEWQELGTSTIPPRPVLGPAAERNHELIRKVLGRALVNGMLGGAAIPAHLDYDHTVD